MVRYRSELDQWQIAVASHEYPPARLYSYQTATNVKIALFLALRSD
jgi:hypothetical protein